MASRKPKTPAAEKPAPPVPPTPPPPEPAAPAPHRFTAGPPRKLFKIGEVVRYTGLHRQTIHIYTMMGLIKPAELTDSGHRLYDEGVFARIERIRMLNRHRPLTEVKEMMDKEVTAP
ncbi:MAG: MerR family transcriptional regulator [Candidatus Brocadiae bacterium]|nr:MerR family transcriptional regulator [Candidatus Brocadiia bacterium]